MLTQLATVIILSSKMVEVVVILMRSLLVAIYLEEKAGAFPLSPSVVTGGSMQRPCVSIVDSASSSVS